MKNSLKAHQVNSEMNRYIKSSNWIQVHYFNLWSSKMRPINQ